MSNNSTVTFKVAGNDVTSFIDKVKQKSAELTASMLADASKQGGAAKDQLKYLEQQIALLDRKNKLEAEAARQMARGNYKQQMEHVAGWGEKDAERVQAAEAMAKTGYQESVGQIKEQEKQAALQTKLLRDQIEAIKVTSNAEVIQMRKGDEGIVQELDKDATPMDKLARDLANEKIQSEKKPEDKPDEPATKTQSQFSAFIKAMAFEHATGLVAGIPNARNELDFIKPMMSMAGMGIGGLAGNGVDAISGISVAGFGMGKTNFAGLGTALGEKAGEMVGNALSRAYEARDQLTTSNYKLQALTGQNLGVDAFGPGHQGGTGMSKIIADLTQYGQDFKATSELQYKLATAKGSGTGLNKDAENVMALQQGLAVSQETSAGLMELQRSSKSENRDVMRLVSGVLSSGQGSIFKGGDHTFLSEFLSKNFAGLHKQLLSTSETVGTATTMDILKKFDSVGGMFSARDPRSGGLIGQIQSSLVNPTSDSMKAYAFMALRKDNPNMGIADLMMEQQKGLGSSKYLKSMLGTVDQLGGDDQMKRMNIAGMFGISPAAAKEIFENRQKLMSGSMKLGDLAAGQGLLSEQGIRESGQAQTGQYTKSTAEIENAFVKDVASAVKMVGSKMESLFGDMINGVKAYVFDQLKGYVVGPTPVSNVVMDGKSVRTSTAKEIANDPSMRNTPGPFK